LFLLEDEGFNVSMESKISSHLFASYQIIGVEPSSISHIQFADNTLILGEKSWGNVRAMRVVLHLFAAMSSLQINFHKSMLKVRKTHKKGDKFCESFLS